MKTFQAKTKTQLAQELEITTKTLSSHLKEIFKQKDAPLKWEQIKNRKLLTPKILNYVYANI